MDQIARKLFGATTLADIMLHNCEFVSRVGQLIREGYSLKETARIMRAEGWG